MGSYPVATTSAGVRIANFSSPHEFRFDDGTVLAACSADRSRMGQLVSHEIESEGIKGTMDVELAFTLSDVILEMLEEIESDEGVDICLVPLPVKQCIASAGLCRRYTKVRGVRMADRVSKVAFHDRFCI